MVWWCLRCAVIWFLQINCFLELKIVPLGSKPFPHLSFILSCHDAPVFPGLTCAAAAAFGPGHDLLYCCCPEMPPEVWRCPGGPVRHSAARTRCSYLSFFASFIDGVLLFLNHIRCKSVNLVGGVHHNGASCPSPPFNCGPRPDGGLAYPSVYPWWPAWLPIQRGWPLNADGLSSM